MALRGTHPFLKVTFLLGTMKVFAFTDTHAQDKIHKALAARIKAVKPDLLLCCGDLSIFGNGLEKSLKTFNAWNLPCLLIHGNHEDPTDLATRVANYENLAFIHSSIVDKDDLTFVGWGGGGFAREDPGLARFLDRSKQLLRQKKRIIFLTHAPPMGTALDQLGPYSVGCKTIRDVPRQLPKTGVMLSGHIHENFLSHDVIGRTFVLNPGPLGVVLDLGVDHVSILEE